MEGIKPGKSAGMVACGAAKSTGFEALRARREEAASRRPERH